MLNIDVHADWRSLTYGRVPNTIDLSCDILAGGCSGYGLVQQVVVY